MNKLFAITTGKPSATQCLSFLVRIVKGLGPPNPVTQKQLTKALSAIKGRLEDTYKMASAPMTQSIGDFCSYCETPLLGLVEVEHTVPKAPYPSFTVSWNNFMLACSPCNIAKSDDPDRATVEGWMGNPVNPTENDYYNEIRNDNYVWPDLLSEAYRWTPTGFYYWGANKWVVVSSVNASERNSKLVSVDIVSRVVTGLIKVGNNMVVKQVGATIDTPSLPAPAPVRCDQMVDLCKLNDWGTPDSTFDRRTMNRTRAWFMCTMMIDAFENTTDQNEFNVVWPTVLMMARVTGFYSVWVALLHHYDDFNYVDLAKRFANDSNVALYFPNTVTTKIP